MSCDIGGHLPTEIVELHPIVDLRWNHDLLLNGSSILPCLDIYICFQVYIVGLLYVNIEPINKYHFAFFYCCAIYDSKENSVYRIVYGHLCLGHTQNTFE